MVTRKTERLVKRSLLWAAAALLAAATLYLSVSTWRVYNTMAGVRAERIEAETERDTTRARTKELAAALDALGTEHGIEQEIRARYPLVKPGEVEFVLVDSPESESATTTISTPGFWDKIWGSLGL